MEIMSKSNLSTNTNNLLPLVCISVLGHSESEEEIQMIWCNLVEMSQENRKVKMKTVRKKNSGHGVKI